MVTLLDIIDKWALEKGQKKNKLYLLKVTTTEIMLALDLKPSPPQHRYVKTMVETHYPGTKAEALGRNGEIGFILHIKIWSK